MSRFCNPLCVFRSRPALVLAAVLLFCALAITFTAMVSADDSADLAGTVIDPVTVASGTVFEDMDRDGIQGGSETGVAGVTVWMRQLPGGTAVVTYPVTTDASGCYTVTRGPLDPGSYQVGVEVPQGYFATTPTVVTKTVTSTLLVEVDFGLRPFYRTILLPVMCGRILP
ncbi:MAG: SdrD B-like domain-containing protein [Anaerolineae bacterium]